MIQSNISLLRININNCYYEGTIINYTARPKFAQPLPGGSNRYCSEPITLKIVVYVWHYALLMVNITKVQKDGYEIPPVVLAHRNHHLDMQRRN